MKVVVAHNRYAARSPSGENEVVDSEIAALSAAGVEVIPYLRSSDEIETLPRLERVTLPARPVYSPWDARAIGTLLDRYEADVLHLHNPYPLISPAAIVVARSRGIPVVQTVHNHRHVCVAGTFFRDGRPCTECVDRRIGLPAIRHGCYRGSRLQSVPMVAALALHRRTFRGVRRFIALTSEIADTIRRLGVPDGRIVIKPNTVDDPGEPEALPAAGFVFVGRLSVEKGIHALLDAWTATAPSPVRGPLEIVGDGPEAARAEARVRGCPDVVFRGRLERAEVVDAMRRARVVVVPSLWPEAFPRVVVEAFACGRPVLTTNVGGLPGIVTPAVGWTVDPSLAGLLAGMQQALADDADAKAGAARERYLTEYHPARVTRSLMQVYDDVVAACGAAPSGALPAR